MTQKVTFKEYTTTKNYMFSYYDRKLSKSHKNLNEANIVVELKTTGERKQIIIYEITPHKTKEKIGEIFNDEICKILLDKTIYRAPNKINTLPALKKALVINTLG